MIEENNPEVNVDELMQKIREEVAKRQSSSQPIGKTSKSDINSTVIYNPIFNHIETLLKNAEFRGSVRTKWPEDLNKFPFNLNKNLQKIILNILNFLFKDQREVNFNLNHALKECVSLNRQLIQQITSLRAQMDEYRGTVNTRLQGMDERLGAVDIHLQQMDERLGTVDIHLQQMDERLGAVDIHLQQMDERLGTVYSRVPRIDEALNGMDSCINSINSINSWMTGIDERLSAVDTRLQGMDERLNTANTRLQGMDERLNTANTRLQGMDERLNTANTRLQGMDERHLRNDNYLKNDLVQQKRLLTMFLEEARRRLPERFNEEQLQTFVNEEQHFPDAFYVAFEDQFRGSREDILNRLKVYLPLIAEAKVGTPSSQILDVGCGRGEWLELLGESGYTAKGIDINRVMVEQCRVRGLEVMESDVIAYLQSLPDASLGAVTGFHIIEHLPFSVLMKLVDETERVLNIGGLAIFETPNPENIIVGACNFYSDPTHRNPLFPPTIKFLFEQRGFLDVKLLRLSEHRLEDPLQFVEADNPIAFQVNPLIEIAKSNFYASPDFAVIAKKVS